MLQIYLVRHGETQWNAERRIQGQSDSLLAAKGEQQAIQVGGRVRSFDIAHVISSDPGRTQRTAEIIAQACGRDITYDSRLHELNMGVLGKRHVDMLTLEGEGWRCQLVNGTVDGRILEGESVRKLSDHVNATLASYLELSPESHSLLISRGIALGRLVSTVLGLLTWVKHRLCLRNCSISRVDYRESL